jgi:hypothetical protein
MARQYHSKEVAEVKFAYWNTAQGASDGECKWARMALKQADRMHETLLHNRSSKKAVAHFRQKARAAVKACRKAK